MSEPQLTKRICDTCNNEMPVRDGTKIIFAKDRSRPSGYESTCCYCKKVKTKIVRDSIESNQAKIDKLHLDVLKKKRREYAEKLTKDAFQPGGVPNIAEVMETMLGYFGGIEMLGLQQAALFLSAKPGSTTRQRVLAMMNNTSTKVSQLGYAKKPLHMLSDEELEQAIAESRKRLLTPRIADTDAKETRRNAAG